MSPLEVHRCPQRPLSPCGAKLLLASLLLFPLAGCGDPPTGAVTGAVTFQGKPVESGNVIFENGEQGIFKAAELTTGGEYRLEGLPLVEYKVSVRPPDPELPNENSGFDGRKPLPKANVAPPKDIPAPYHSSQTTPLRHTVAKGEQRFDIPLEK